MDIEMFKPNLTLCRVSGSEKYKLYSVTLTPNTGYRRGEAVASIPGDYLLIPESQGVTLNITHVGGISLQMITPVRHFLEIDLGRGKTSVTAFVVVDGKVVGSGSVPIADAFECPKDKEPALDELARSF